MHANMHVCVYGDDFACMFAAYMETTLHMQICMYVYGIMYAYTYLCLSRCLRLSICLSVCLCASSTATRIRARSLTVSVYL